jgi:hypothetical protein
LNRKLINNTKNIAVCTSLNVIEKEKIEFFHLSNKLNKIREKTQEIEKKIIRDEESYSKSVDNERKIREKIEKMSEILNFSTNESSKIPDQDFT